ncbi:MAG: hypothetical protein GOU97_01150 [Nanoarchaeota archaeon]|nr:hypothetical protein [Nanoarchaeota archaeon]
MNWFEQIFITFSLVLGTVAGESLVIKAFGRPKKGWHALIQVLGFIILVVIMLNSITTTNTGFRVVSAIYFLTSFLAIVFINGLTTLIGFSAVKVKKTVTRQRSEESKIIGLYRSLKHKGVKEKDIICSLEEAGFKKTRKVVSDFKKLSK